MAELIKQLKEAQARLMRTCDELQQICRGESENEQS